MKKLFYTASTLICLSAAPVFMSRTPTKSAPPHHQTALTPTSIARIDNDTYVGPGTAKIIGPRASQSYTFQEIRDLRAHANAPLLILTPDDLEHLSHPKDVGQSMKEIKLWLPPSFHVSEVDIINTLTDLVTGRYQTFFAYDSDKKLGQKQHMVGGIIVIPGSSYGTNCFRAASDINFRSGALDRETLRETKLFTAAHEASHVEFTFKGNNSEINGEMGAYAFVKKHPEYFRNLAVPEKAKAIIRGYRALKGFVETDMIDEHNTIAFSSLNGDYRLPFSRLPHTQKKLMDEIAKFMKKIGVLPKVDATGDANSGEQLIMAMQKTRSEFIQLYDQTSSASSSIVDPANPAACCEHRSHTRT